MKKFIILAITTIAIISAISLGRIRHKQDIALKSEDSSSTTKLPTIVELGSHSCASCKAMALVLNDLNQTHKDKIKIVKIDVFEDQDATEKYNIRAIPTQIFLNDKNNEFFRHEGFFSKEDILKKFSEHQLIN